MLERVNLLLVLGVKLAFISVFISRLAITFVLRQVIFRTRCRARDRNSIVLLRLALVLRKNLVN
jgi:hypothetical protein